MPKPLIIAHRGATTIAPENTIAAFAGAIALHADMVELDVRRTSDRVLVVHHDPTIQGQAIADLTWSQVQDIAPHVPTLEAVIQTCKGQIQVDFELKEAGYEAAVLDLILRYLPLSEFIVTSFLLEAIAQVRSHHDQVQIGLLLTHKHLAENPLAQQGILCERLRSLCLNYVLPHHSMWRSAELCQQVPTELPMIVWTVNDPASIRDFCQQPQIVGVVSDNVGMAIETCR
jgi:glycerophosphoryl diester phosphodiesterase